MFSDHVTRDQQVNVKFGVQVTSTGRGLGPLYHTSVGSLISCDLQYFSVYLFFWFVGLFVHLIVHFF